MTLSQICWVSPEEGGRKTPFKGSHYVTVARFEEEPNRWQTESWSLVVDFREESSNDGSALADVKFLVEEAPSYLLHAGSRFELLEGPHVVAKGKVLAD